MPHNANDATTKNICKNIYRNSIARIRAILQPFQHIYIGFDVETHEPNLKKEEKTTCY